MIIDESFNICNVFKYITKIKGVLTGSSPTDAWIVTFKNDIYNSNEEQLKKGFLKIYLDLEVNKSLEKQIKENDINLYYSIKGLNYESQVYKIVTELVNKNICPNFVRYIAEGKLCRYDDLYNILTVQKNFKQNVLKEKLKRSIEKNMLQYSTYNYKIDEPSNLKKNIKKKSKILKYNYSIENINFCINMTESFDEQKSFHELLYKKKLSALNISNIVFQILLTCHIMSLSKISHNDLHTSNIMVKQMKTPINIAYIINGKLFLLNTYFKIYIFDWDRSYVKRLGKNNSIEYLYREFSQINEIIENKDILKFMCHLTKYKKSQKYIECLSDDKNLIKELMDFYNDKRCNFLSKDYKPVDLSFFGRFNDSFTILNKFYDLLPKLDIKQTKIFYENIHVIDNNFFDSNGNIDDYIYQDILEKELLKYENYITMHKSVGDLKAIHLRSNIDKVKSKKQKISSSKKRSSKKIAKSSSKK